MSEIYSQSYRTVVWLGMDSDADPTAIFRELSLPYPEAAMAFVCHLVKHWDPSQPAQYYTADPETRSGERKTPDPQCSFVPSLHECFQSPIYGWMNRLRPLELLFNAKWFSRKWVIQEVALSRSVDVLFHNCRISWRWIGLAASIMRTRYDDALREHRLYNVYNAYLMFRLSERYDLEPAKMTFVQLLRLTSGFETSEPRDTFFALSGLKTSDHDPSDGPLLKPDYRAPYEHICTTVARTMLEIGRSRASGLDVLLNAGITGK